MSQRALAGVVLVLLPLATGAHAAAPHARSNAELLAALTGYAPQTEGVPEAAADELVRRRAVDDTVAAFARPVDGIQQRWAAQILRRIGGPTVVAKLRPLATRAPTLTAYLACHDLAAAGDASALATLSRNYDRYPVSSAEWAATVRLFGTARYCPAAPRLADSLQAASLNVVDAAREALGALFPGEAREAASLDDLQRHWRDVVRRWRAAGSPAVWKATSGCGRHGP